MKSPLTLQELKERFGYRSELFEKRERFSFSRWETGIPKGAITEITGPGKTAFVADFLKERPDERVIWIEESFSLFPLALEQRGVAPEQVLFVDIGRENSRELEWTLLQALRSQAFSIAVLYSEFEDSRMLRRIQLATESAHAATLWLRSTPHASQTSALSLRIERDPVTDERRPIRLRER